MTEFRNFDQTQLSSFQRQSIDYPTDLETQTKLLPCYNQSNNLANRHTQLYHNYNNQTNNSFLNIKELQKACSLLASLSSLKHHRHTRSLSNCLPLFKCCLQICSTPKSYYFCYKNFHSGNFFTVFSIYFLTTVNFKDKLFFPVRILIISQNLRQYLRMKNKVPTKSLVFGNFKTLLYSLASQRVSMICFCWLRQLRQYSIALEQSRIQSSKLFPCIQQKKAVKSILSILNC